MRNTIVVLAIALFLSAGVSAYSQEKADDPARISFKQGVEYFNAGRYEEAVKSFREANRLSPAWKLLYNIGQSEAAAKRYGLALEAFEEYLSKGGDEIPKDREQEVLSELERLRKMVSTVEIKGKEGDKVVVNGSDRGVLPAASRLKVEMGMMKLQVERKEQIVLVRELKLSGGEMISIEVPQEEKKAEVATKPTKEQPVAAPTEQTEQEQKPKRVWTWVAWGVGGAAAIGTAITGGVASSKSSSLDDNCPDKVCPDSERDRYDSAKSLAITTDVLIGVAVAGAVTGTMLFFFEPKLGASDETVALHPIASLDGAGLSIEGRF